MGIAKLKSTRRFTTFIKSFQEDVYNYPMLSNDYNGRYKRRKNNILSFSFSMVETK